MGEFRYLPEFLFNGSVLLRQEIWKLEGYRDVSLDSGFLPLHIRALKSFRTLNQEVINVNNQMQNSKFEQLK